MSFFARALAACAALCWVGCNVSAEGAVPCYEDASCPKDYPSCKGAQPATGNSAAVAGVCVSASPTSSTAEARIVGVQGYPPGATVHGTVRVSVLARASSGVKKVDLTATGATPAIRPAQPDPPLYVFEVETSGDGQAQLTAHVTPGDGSAEVASSALAMKFDNTQPAVTVVSQNTTDARILHDAVILEVNASEELSSIEGVIFRDNVEFTRVPGGRIAGNSWRITYEVGDIAVGTYEIGVDATDLAGNATSGGTALAQRRSFTARVVPVPTAHLSFQDSTGQTISDRGIAIDPGENVTLVPEFSGEFSPSSVTLNGAVLGSVSKTAKTISNVRQTTTYTLQVANELGKLETDSVRAAVNAKIYSFTGVQYFTVGHTAAQLSATFEGSGTGSGSVSCSGTQVTSCGLPAGGMASGSTVTASPTFNTPPTGDVDVTYRLSVQATGAPAFDRTADCVVHVVQPATPTLLPSGPIVVDSGSSFTLTPTFNFNSAFGLGKGNAAAWIEEKNGTTNETRTYPLNAEAALTLAKDVTATTTFTYKLNVVNAANVTSTSSPVTVNMYPTPTIASFRVNGTPTFTAGSGQPLSFSATYSNASSGAVTNDGDGCSSTYCPSFGLLGNGTPTVRSAGSPAKTYHYTLTVQPVAPATRPAATQVTVVVAPGSWGGTNTTSNIRFGANVTRLDTGRILIAGGYDSTGEPVNTALVCTPTGLCNAPTPSSTDTTHHSAMNGKRAFHSAVLLPNGNVLITGGYTSKDKKSAGKSAELYDPGADGFTVTSPSDMGTARAEHTSTVIPGIVLVAGGFVADTGGTATKTTEVYNAAAATFASGTPMSAARAGHTATVLNDNKLFVVGGNSGPDTTSETFDGTSWTPGPSILGEVKSGHSAVKLSAGSNTGSVLVTGGKSASSSQYLASPTASSLTSTSQLALGRSAHAAIELPGSQQGKVLICGGTLADGTRTASCELVDATSGVTTTGPTGWMLSPRASFGLVASNATNVLAATGETATLPLLLETFTP